jgi:DNA polymerase
MQQMSLLSSAFGSLAEVEQIAKSCTLCKLCETRTFVVFSDGNPQAKLMIIGEGPGHNEDVQGIPFVGRAGQMLNKILESVNIDRQKDTYICNVVKCRPPQNRVPTKEEVQACRPYLDAQIELIKPGIILLAGSTAVQWVLELKDPISRIRGKWFSYPSGAKVMPIFHPSYLLRNDTRAVGSPKWLMWQDIQEVRKALDELE